MYRFFIDSDAVSDSIITITGKDYNHIKNVLRMSVGEELTVSNGVDREYVCTISSYDNDSVQLKIIDINSIDVELPLHITLFQGLPKADKMELIIQKAVELGVYEIVPVMTQRTIVKYDEKKTEKKVQRWNEIAKSAAKQAKRGLIPKVTIPMNFQDALFYAQSLDVNIIPYEEAKNMDVTRETLTQLVKHNSCGIFIGPEGGFDESEIMLATNADMKPITLGKRILRTETAGMAVLSMIVFATEK
ncbi:MAG: 16S rRNA (uracil(1498)-N(3))-methyltransferase [Lachnospiraceae bacterium]